MSKTLPKLGAAFDRRNWQWLQDNYEDIADGLKEEVSDGASPDEVKRFILSHVGSERTGMADRCMSASRYLESQRVKT